jgi:hypothetical protein
MYPQHSSNQHIKLYKTRDTDRIQRGGRPTRTIPSSSSVSKPASLSGRRRPARLAVLDAMLSCESDGAGDGGIEIDDATDDDEGAGGVDGLGVTRSSMTVFGSAGGDVARAPLADAGGAAPASGAGSEISRRASAPTSPSFIPAVGIGGSTADDVRGR